MDAGTQIPRWGARVSMRHPRGPRWAIQYLLRRPQWWTLFTFHASEGRLRGAPHRKYGQHRERHCAPVARREE
jgi:hypothetical protein